MFRKTLSALVAVAGLSFAGAAFAAPAATTEKPAVGTVAKPSSGKKIVNKTKVTKVTAKTETKAPKAQPRKASNKVVRASTNKKVVRASTNTAKPAATTPVAK